MVEDKLITKIRKLILLSKHNENENEAALAAAKAQELLIMHNLSITEIEIEQHTEPEESITAQQYDHKKEGRKNEEKWRVLLASAVARSNLCKVIHIGGYRSSLSWIGKPSNIEVAIYMYETLVSDIEFIADRRWKQVLMLREISEVHPEINIFEDETLYTIHGKEWKNNFYLGAVDAIDIRLKEGMSQLQENNNITALVTLNEAALDDFINNKWSKLRTYKVNQGYGAGYRAGRAAGREIQFRRGINGAGGSLGPKLIDKG